MSPPEPVPMRRRIARAAAVLIIVVLGVRFLGICSGSRADDEYRLAHYVCDACGEHFAARRRVPPVACPQCGKRQGVLLSWMACRDCGHRYEGLRYRPVPGREDEFAPKRAADVGVVQIKWRDGAWLVPNNEESLAMVRKAYACPQCQSTNVSPLAPPAQAERGVPREVGSR